MNVSKQQWAYAAVAALAALGIMLFVKSGLSTPKAALEKPTMPRLSRPKAPEPAALKEPVTIVEPPPAKAVVHVAGHVKAPGVYTLPVTARIIDAVKAAGGSKPDAQLDAVNLAAHVQDGEQIFLPGKSDPAEQGAAASQPLAPAPGAAPKAVRTASSRASSKASLSGKININRAGPDELDKLPGVGPSTAASIIEYRKAAGGFSKPEDLMNVKGIGPKKYSQMQRYLTVR